jgi:PAS domain-containing protein
VSAYAADTDGNYVFVNSYWTRLTGISQTSALKQGWLESIHPEDRQEVSKAWLDAVKGERYFGLSYRLQLSHPAAGWVLSQAIPQHNDDGELTGYGGTLVSLSQLSGGPFSQFSDARLRPILDLLDCCYYEHDLVTGALTCSPACLQLIGEARNSQEFDALVHPDDLAEVKRRFDQFLAEGQLFQAEYRIAGPDRRFKRVRDYAKLIRDADGRALCAVGILAPADAFQESANEGICLLSRLKV